MFSIAAFSQNKMIELKIDSITFNDPDKNERDFTINYHIENLTNNPVSLILNTNSIKPNASSSMSYSPSYRLYQGDEIINAEHILNSKIAKEKFEQTKKDFNKRALTKDSPKINIYEQMAENKKKTSLDIVNSIIKLNPKEIKNFSTILSWNKIRNFRYFDNEYYLDEKATHYFDLFVNLFSEELKERILPEDFKKIIEDKTIIKGWIASNKMEINFKE